MLLPAQTCFFFAESTVAQLGNTKPSTVFADACIEKIISDANNSTSKQSKNILIRKL